MAQIKVGSGLVKPKSINVYDGAQWFLKKVGYVFNNGVWEQFIHYHKWFVENGIIVYQPVTNNARYPDSTVTTMNGYLRLLATPINTGSGYVPNNLRVDFQQVNLTDYNKLTLLFAASAPGDSICDLRIFKPSPDYNLFLVRSLKGTGTRQIEIDVSSISGEVTIRFDINTALQNGVWLYIYQMWME